MNSKVWVVTLTQGLEVTEAAVFDKESDAEHYAHEMAASKQGNYQILSSVLNSRAELEQEETHWAEIADFDTACIECLFEELSAVSEEEFDRKACTLFLEEHKDDLQKKADEIVHEYLRKELRDYISNERVILG